MSKIRDRNELFRGHFEECFRHFVTAHITAVPKGSKESAKAKKPIADFCGVAIQTVTRWLYTQAPPNGEPLIRLMCYLDMVGYTLIELERMPKVHRNFLELVGYGLLTGDEATEFLGYSSASTFYHVLRGKYNSSEDKKEKMWNAWKERREILQQRKDASQELLRPNIPPRVCPEVELPKTTEEMPTGLEAIADTLLLLAAQVRALSSSQNISKQERGQQ